MVKIKNIFISLMSLTLLSTSFVSCASNVVTSGSSNLQQETTKISFFGYKADDLNLIAIENALHSYMDVHPEISIVYEGVKGQAYWNALALRDKSNNLDDVFMVDQGRLTTMEDKIEDLSDLVNLDMYNDLVKDQIIREDGKVLFIPMNYSAYCLYINRDMLKRDGQPIPNTLSEFKNVCNFYVNEKHISPIICNNNNSLRTIIEACGLYDVYSKPESHKKISSFNDNPTLLGDYLKEGISLVGEMIDNGWIDAQKTKNTSQTSGDLNEFIKGENPFMITGGWTSLIIKDLLKKNNKKMDFGVYPYPVKEDGGVLLLNVTTCISVNKNSKNLEEAKKFVSYFVNPNSIWEYCDTQCCFSPLKNETRIPSDSTVSPTAPYYTNGRAVIGADFHLDIPLDLYLTDCTLKMLDGMNVEDTNAHLLDLLAGKIIL